MKIFWLWLTLAALTTVLCALAYILVQQDIRQSANYPQSQIAEDVTSATAVTAVTAVTAGPNTASGLVDISASLAPFVSTFDVDGNVIRSNAILNGTTPVPPHGVFGYAMTNGEDRFTWQPQVGIRIAAVLVYHPATGAASASSSAFFVLSGRSLRDVEVLESRFADDTFFVWLAAIIIMFILSIFTAQAFRQRTPDEKVLADKIL